MLTNRPGPRDAKGMRAVVQRVSRARVVVEGESVGSIGVGLLVLVGAMHDDQAADVAWMDKKLASLRVFADEAGKMNRSVRDVGGSILLVSQFTLCAETSKGNRPSFGAALAPEKAAEMIGALAAALRSSVPVETGRFGADMAVELTNDGPVTILLDSRGGS